MTPQVTSIDHLVLTVRDMPASIAFYTETLGMSQVTTRHSDGSTRVALSFGSQKINLHQAGQEFAPCAKHPTPGSADLCFLSTSSLELWQGHFTALGVEVIEGPVRRTGATGAIQSLYIRDLDANLIEVSIPT
ncbi:MAG: VOC family protein [Pseudomonadota bacterium]